VGRIALSAWSASSIPTIGFPSTTETIGQLLRLASVEKEPHPAIGPRDMREIYECNVGRLPRHRLRGPDEEGPHRPKGMSETLLPLLRERWAH
jgi:hypothetical protein